MSQEDSLINENNMHDVIHSLAGEMKHGKEIDKRLQFLEDKFVGMANNIVDIVEVLHIQSARIKYLENLLEGDGK